MTSTSDREGSARWGAVRRLATCFLLINLTVRSRSHTAGLVSAPSRAIPTKERATFP
jgi:hypothetical protein